MEQHSPDLHGTTGRPPTDPGDRLAAALRSAVDDPRLSLVARSFDAVMLTDREGVILHVNRSAGRSIGYAPGDLVGRLATSIVHDEDRQHTHQKLLECAATPGYSVRDVFRARHKDGSWRWYEGVAVNRLDEPDIGAVVLSYRDITEARFRELADSLPQTVFEIDLDGNVTFVNRSGYGMWLATQDDVDRGANIFDWIVAEDHERAHRNMQRALAGETPGSEYRARKKDGTVFPVVVHSRPILREGRPVGLRGIVIDVTEQKRAEEARRRSEQRFRSLVKNAIFGIYRSTLDGRFVEVNPALVSMLGYDSEEDLLSVPVLALYRDPRDRRVLLERFRYSTRVAGVEAEWKRKDGAAVVVRLNGRWISDSEDGYPEGFEMIVEDVTDRRVLEEQFQQAQKMEAIGRLAGGIAHDFNNLLTAILGYADLLVHQIDGADPRRGDLEQIVRAAQRASSLTRQLLAFGRKQVLQPEPLDLASVVLNVEPMLRRLIGEDVRLQIAGGRHLATIKADPGQIEQVIMNLAVNARDAMPGGGTLRVETANVDLDEQCAPHHNAVPGAYVMLAVSDTGCGMTPEVKAHLFEPFFTTKPRDRGTGLGLASVYGIIRQSGGHVFVNSEPGRGTTFKIYFPRFEAAQDPVGSLDPDPADMPRGCETVLLVEDDRAVRTLAEQVLARQGYRVLSASNGEDALQIAAGHQGTIALLVADVVMPQMSGPVLANRLTAMRPEARVLFVSGYTDHAIVANGELTPNVAFLQKPFTRQALAQSVRATLDRE
jgi:PAS domain S-box-containing protein